MFEKISGVEAGAVCREMSGAIRNLVSENSSLREKVAHYERLERSRYLASKMDDGMRQGASIEEAAQKLAHSEENLDILEKAIELRAQDPKLASIGDGPVVVDYSNPQTIPQGKAAEAMNSWLLQDPLAL